MSRRATILATLATALAALGMVLFARDFIYEGVVVPLLYLVWLGNLALNSADQAFLWIAAVFILLVVLIRGLNVRPKPLGRGSAGPLERTEKGRVAFWAVKMALGARGEYSKRYFYQELKKLVLATLGLRESLSPREVEEALRNGELAIPNGLEEFVQSWKEEGYTPNPSWWQRLVDLFNFKQPAVRRGETNLDLEQVERMIQQLENQLEIRK